MHADDPGTDRRDPSAHDAPGAWPRGPGIPPESRMRRGPVAVVECFEEIPCDPCEPACPRGAIRVGSPITNLPVLDPDRCDGCGLCIPACPGQAVFVVDLSLPDGMASVSMPYEFLPLPRKGDVVLALDRNGQPLGPARVLRVANPRSFDKTPVVTIEVPEAWAASARGVRAGDS